MSAYDSVSRGSLKLKGVTDHKIKKKKKKKDKEKEVMKMIEQTASNISASEEDELGSSDGGNKVQVDKRTKAELAFVRAKEKKQGQQLLERAAQTHKDRIMKFNRHLDQMTEHFDIPKVSWTK